MISLKARAVGLVSYQQNCRVRFGMGRNVKPLAGIHFVRLRDADAVGCEAAGMVAAQLLAKPESSIVFPTGRTPLPMYKVLRHMPHLNWRQSRLFHLDEYVNPAPRAPRVPYEAYAEYMNRELWDYITARKHYFDHYSQKPDEYERLVSADDGPDLVILGIGGNGHIAFNEPGSLPDSPARVIDLAEQTIKSNFGSVGKAGYPLQAVTLGLGTILSARKIILLATGQDKQAIVQKVFNPKTKPSKSLPASWLKQHPDVTVLTDFEVQL